MRHVLLALLVLLLAVPARAEDAPRDYDTEKDAYKAWLERPSLYMRHKGRVEFAQTKDVRAFRVLAKSYAKPEKPKDQVRYLLASICGDHFREPAHLDTWRGWRKKNAKARDAWLWYRGLEVDCHIDGTPETVAVARDHSTHLMRATALEVLIARKDEAALTLAAGWLAALPTKGHDRALLLESAAEALYQLRKHRKTEPWTKLLAMLRQHLDGATTSERTRRVIARRLMLIDDALPKASDPGRYAPPVKPTFFGIQGSGNRIVFVIDMSDSMLTPLTEKEFDDLQKPYGKAAKSMGEAIKKLPWVRIDTRFDAAREFLKLALRGLTPQQSFCVIGFGSEAKFLAATPGLRKATEKHIEKACVELDTIVAEPPTRGRPHGMLWGYTNLHGGLHRAFKVRSKSPVKTLEYVDASTFTDGCDTIFLLSDGKPTWDDWPEWDLRLDKHKSGDPESGAETKDHEKGHYYGPYALASWLRDDLRRLNLFRKAEIHCVGIGEHDPHLLRWISQQGLGQFRKVPANE